MENNTFWMLSKPIGLLNRLQHKNSCHTFVNRPANDSARNKAQHNRDNMRELSFIVEVKVDSGAPERIRTSDLCLRRVSPKNVINHLSIENQCFIWILSAGFRAELRLFRSINENFGH